MITSSDRMDFSDYAECIAKLAKLEKIESKGRATPSTAAGQEGAGAIQGG
jgi:hypothetical protein